MAVLTLTLTASCTANAVQTTANRQTTEAASDQAAKPVTIDNVIDLVTALVDDSVTPELLRQMDLTVLLDSIVKQPDLIPSERRIYIIGRHASVKPSTDPDEDVTIEAQDDNAVLVTVGGDSELAVSLNFKSEAEYNAFIETMKARGVYDREFGEGTWLVTKKPLEGGGVQKYNWTEDNKGHILPEGFLEVDLMGLLEGWYNINFSYVAEFF